MKSKIFITFLNYKYSKIEKITSNRGICPLSSLSQDIARVGMALENSAEMDNLKL